ncbi:hypothetical protein PHMEG_00022896 [Phytophthora megakarya]|uniref:Aspartic protease n=1 Tax=Phytophthora megakarya TaxID=4795 RepID=A0A225VHJ7_9STRA|nr:hypothetical protein PHMEG_00022896 [Phytophthora megakarya]
MVKVTLGWNTVYEFEFWVMDHSAGSEVVVGIDLMIPAGIRLGLFNTTAKLTGEEMVPLVKSLSTDEDSAERMHVTGGPTEILEIPTGGWIEFQLQKKKPSLGTHDVWVRRTAAIFPTIIRFRKVQPTQVRLTNITDRVVYCPAQLNVIAWYPGALCQNKLVTNRSTIGTYASSHDETWLKLECEFILQKPDEHSSDGDDSLSQDEQWADDVYAVHKADYISLEDYAQELAFLPDLTEPSVTEVDYTASNMKSSSFVGDQQRRLDDVLKSTRRS